MLFYMIEGLFDREEFSGHDRDVREEAKENLSLRCSRFNRQYDCMPYCFVYAIDCGTLTAGMILEHPGEEEETVDAFLQAAGLELRDRTIQEVTIRRIFFMLRSAERQGYIEDSNEVKKKVGPKIEWDELSGGLGRGVRFGESLLEERSRAEIYQEIGRYLMDKTLLPELDRIYAKPSSGRWYGHPVHYLIQTSNRDSRWEVCRLLLGALYANKRLENRRYSFLDLGEGGYFSKASYDALYRASFGGAVIVRYCADGDSDGEDNVACGSEEVEIICETAKRYRNRVLTVFCLPRQCAGIRARFYENLGTVSLVEIQEELAGGEQTRAFLKRLAKTAGIRTDRKLFEKIEENRGYLVSEIQTVFDDWYNAKLKTSVFPQYKKIDCVKEKAVRAKPQGSAYEQLQEMIGLRDAKEVLQKALSYFKMQKLYAERGVQQNRPAMHMVFTGNPGTAKTTVARLFARIMKENGLLSMGHLVEVGRGDLVGKYVGWTAQIVQQKFKMALGGVLFIDEAYSLAERDGLYGDEAINTIVQEMENHREDVVVIFAGYPDKMEAFIKKNPGLRSRIAFHVPFADYDADELCAIARLMLKKKELSLGDGADEKLRAVLAAARKQEDFGNGRYVRNVLEQAQMAQAERLLSAGFESITDRELRTIRAEDIPAAAEAPNEKRRIGFCA